MFDYHIHSNFSADCEAPMERTVEKAIDIGLKEICFTDHIDYDYPDESIVFEFDQEAYDQKIREVQFNYGDRIHIKKGIEIGLQPHLLERYNELLENRRFDFVICSMHTAEGKDLHSGNFFAGRSAESSCAAYYNELLSCVKEFSNYSILGHIDLVKRYLKTESRENFHEIIREIFQEIIPKGKGIELNTSGKRYGMEQGMPSLDILKLYKECGGEILTLGSDSHVESTIAYDFRDSIELLKKAGFRYITTFNQGSPEFHKLSKL
ncbi:histidinol-phosphatase HisJ family protein [Virgibacillus siamensis]|uniref:histidinol-phosphatase HisJ family protein n=1 Tax=Virgibacillus siamensis TaxID=480071 RepID=UPI000985A29E|nr:histidinol-phosphatase HisJ family protein [Virgibacillus siamensis]